MKLFAQHGAQEGGRINEAASSNVIDGVLYSPRDIGLGALQGHLSTFAADHPAMERLIDPQFYAIFLNGKDGSRLGYLLEEYRGYFQMRRRSQLEREKQVQEDLFTAMQFQTKLRVTGIIAPNVLIPRSFNSIEAVISKNFLRATGPQYRKLKDPRPVYATLAVSRDALNDKQELIDFLNEITLLEDPPKGFYILVAARSSEARSDIYNADVIAGWMLMNHTFKLNGFDVVNGYSDILTPFLGAAGASAGASGWWSNLRTFSLDRFGPSLGGGRLPIQRYLSTRLLNRITYFELDALRNKIPAILNRLPLDAIYEANPDSGPPRSKEVLQSWEALKSLNSKLVADDPAQGVTNCLQAVREASLLYESIPISLDPKSNDEHLEPLLEGLRLFAKMAEIDLAADQAERLGASLEVSSR